MLNFDDANNGGVRQKCFCVQAYVQSPQMGGKEPLQLYNVSLRAKSSTKAGPNVLVLHATTKTTFEDDGQDEEGATPLRAVKGSGVKGISGCAGASRAVVVVP